MPATLLMPCAGLSTRYPGMRPKWMLTTPSGELAIERAVRSICNSSYQRLVFGFRADQEEIYACARLAKSLFGGDTESVIIERDTRGPADTVGEIIARAAVTGEIIVKDCDSFFDAGPLPGGSFLGVVDVRQTPSMQSVGAKSFARINEHGLVIEIVEKSVISNHVSAGVYGFASASTFMQELERRRGLLEDAEIFVSHIMNAGILHGDLVESVQVKNLVDVGTLADWRKLVQAAATLICDLDGVIFKNQSKHFAPTWDEPEAEIAGNTDYLLALEQGGAFIVFMTSRPERYREKTLSSLRALGFKAHTLIMDVPHSRRFLINDHARTNPFPSAVGISIPRNQGALPDHLTEWLT